VKCYAYGKIRHMSWEYLERKNLGGGEAHISKAQKRNVKEEMKAEVVEEGRSLMMRKFIVNLEKGVREPIQRNNLFRTSCKTRDMVCKVIIDSGSTNNLVST
jgi:hypothetical protein